MTRAEWLVKEPHADYPHSITLPITRDQIPAVVAALTALLPSKE